MNKKAKISFALFAVFSLVATITYSYVTVSNVREGSQQSLIYKYAKDYDFSVYEPARDSSEFVVDTSTIKQNEDSLIYIVKNEQKNITITQQKKTNESDSMKIDGFTSIVSKIGTLQIGETQGITTAILTTTDSIITLRGDVSSSDISRLVDGLIKSESL